MWTVAACLMPPLILSVFIFGFQTLIITAVSVISCVAVEAITQKWLNRPITVNDGSAVVTGILIAFIIPPSMPLWVLPLGAIMAIYIGKHLLGGIGYNIFNPALLARAFLMATFPVAMTAAWLAPLDSMAIFSFYSESVDAVSAATPLYLLAHGGMDALVEEFGSPASFYGRFFLGWRPGCIGETSGLLILLGGLFLIYKKYITWHTPVAMLGTIALLTWIFGGEESLFAGDPILAVLSGGAILGAFFMATDYVTAPMGAKAKLVFGFGVGALTVLIRLKGGYPEGVAYAILLMNPMTPVLEDWFRPQRFAPPLESDQ
jgi:electron transport complex protein RnfD